METKHREKLAEGFVGSGMTRDRARLVVDVGVKAAEDAIAKLVASAGLVGDLTGNMAALSVALQLVQQECQVRFAIMQGVAELEGAPTTVVQVGGD